MKKYIKKIILMCIVTTLTLGISTNAHAAGENRDGYSPKAVRCEISRTYKPSSTTRGVPIVSTVVTAKNSTGTQQSMSYTKSREVYFKGSVTLSAEANYIVGSIGGSVEAGYGNSYTKSVSINLVVPAYTTYYVDVGSLQTSTSGYLVNRFEDCSTTSKSVWVKFTTGQYVEWR